MMLAAEFVITSSTLFMFLMIECFTYMLLKDDTKLDVRYTVLAKNKRSKQTIRVNLIAKYVSMTTFYIYVPLNITALVVMVTNGSKSAKMM